MMNNHTIAGVDLAKDVIQVCLVKDNKVHSNVEMTTEQFTCWLGSTKPLVVVFESCGTSNYWKQLAIKLGHDGNIISARLVAQIRQNQKTDKNDALAIVQASPLTGIRFVSGKSFKQQELQSIIRMRELAIKTRVAHLNQIKSLLLEFNLKSRAGSLRPLVEQTLEDAENGFSMIFRQTLKAAWDSYLSIIEAINQYDKCLTKAANEHPDCKKLMALEGVKTINAVYLYLSLGCSEQNVFRKGSDAAACIGLTPIQYSSGGKVVKGTIGKYSKNTLIRKSLISGAMSVVKVVNNRPPKTAKEAWLKGLIERRGNKCAAVALANKTVRTAYSMLTNGTQYKTAPLVS
jgi:transposase